MKAAIVGAGIAGIAAAIRLRVQGYDVDVFEANAHTGGKMSVVEHNGYRWDAGPSLFTLPELVDELFEIAGEDPRAHFNYVRHSVSCKYFWESGEVLTAWAERDRFAREVERVLDEPAEQIAGYLEQSEAVFQLTRSIFLESSLHKPMMWPRKDVLRALSNLPALQLGKSLHASHAARFQSPKVQQLFDRYATYNGSSPYKTPAVMRLIPHLEHNLGTYLPMGGIHAIAGSLTRLAERIGVRFHLNTSVERIDIASERVVGVSTSHGQHPADIVVSNMDVVPSYRKLMPDQKAPERTLRQERSSSALIFYWAMDRKFPSLDLHNICFSADYLKEFEAIFESGTTPEAPTVYVNITSKLEPGDAPSNGENWFVMINVPSDTGQDWDALIPQARKSIIALLERTLGEPVADHIVHESLLEPRTIASKTSSYQGALYGASSNAMMSAFLRHPNFSRKISGLFFCGGSVHPGGGIPLCLLSAKLVAQLAGPSHS